MFGMPFLTDLFSLIDIEWIHSELEDLDLREKLALYQYHQLLGQIVY